MSRKERSNPKKRHSARIWGRAPSCARFPGVPAQIRENLLIILELKTKNEEELWAMGKWKSKIRIPTFPPPRMSAAQGKNGRLHKTLDTCVPRSWNRIYATQPWPFPTPAERRSVGMESTFFFQECVKRAVVKCPSLADKTISPHLIRHTCAMHLLQAGGISPSSRCGLVMKAFKRRMDMLKRICRRKSKCLRKWAPAGQNVQRFKADDALLRFLSAL